MSNKDYIPKPDVKFIIWAERLSAYSTLNCERWLAPPPTDIVGTSLKDLQEKYERTLNANVGKVDMLEKKLARKKTEKLFRSYVQGFIAKNPNVTESDREEMGLAVRDTVPTPVGDPVGLVTASVRYLNEGALELHIVHVEGSPYDKRANYGVKIVYDVFPFDVPVAEDVSFLRRNVFTRRKKELFMFDRNDARKTACFCLRYENSKGRAGQWGPVVNVVIP